MFSCLPPEKRVPADHALRPIRRLNGTVLHEMSPGFARRAISKPSARRS